VTRKTVVELSYLITSIFWTIRTLPASSRHS